MDKRPDRCAVVVAVTVERARGEMYGNLKARIFEEHTNCLL